MKVLLAILSSSGELYQKTTETILDEYNEMKNRFKLQCEFDIMTILSGDKTERVENIFYVNCDDSDIASKQLAVNEYINEHDEYDVIIRTNATTVVNLNYADIIARKFLNDNEIYTTYFVNVELKKYGIEDFYYPIGNFMMFSKSLFQKYFSNAQLYNDCINELSDKVPGFFTTSTFGYWKGIPDDLILGYMLVKQNAKIALINCSSFIVNAGEEYNTVYENTLVFVSKSKDSFNENDYKDRINIEPLLLNMAAQLMISNPIENIETLHFWYTYNF